MITFAVQRSQQDKERSALALAAIYYPNEFQLKWFDKVEQVPKDYIPAGNLDWVEGVGKIVKPDYYPEWARPLYNRRIWECNTWPMEKNIFVKPSDKHKRFSARITNGTLKGKKKGPYICSSLVTFVDEWRLYISNGRIQYCGWYDGEEKELDKKYWDIVESLVPLTYCGAVDVGFLNTGEFTLVECNSPYSCGWYGRLTEGYIYAKWLAEGWKYINE